MRLAIINKLNQEEKIIFWSLILMLISELIVLSLFIYFSRFEDFVFFFINGIRLTSPILFSFNFIFLIFTLFTRKAKLTIIFWGAYLRRCLKYFFGSLMLTVILITVSSLIGALIGLWLKKFYYLFDIKDVIESMRDWVNANFY